MDGKLLGKFFFINLRLPPPPPLTNLPKPISVYTLGLVYLSWFLVHHVEQGLEPHAGVALKQISNKTRT